MASDSDRAQSKASQRRPRRPPIAGLVVLLIVGGAVALPMMMDSGCTPTRGSATGRTEPMELWGQWLGMMLASADSPSARSLGIVAPVAGVVVADVGRDAASRVAQSGLVRGDVIVKVDGTPTGNLAELYTLTTRLDTARALPFEIMRQGQTTTVVLPPPMEALQQPPIAMQAQPAWPGAGTPAAAPNMAQPATPALVPQPGVAQPMQQAPTQQANAAGWPAVPGTMPPSNGVPGVMGP